MKALIAAALGAVSGWVIVSVTDEVAIAMASGAAIGMLATIALFGTQPARSVIKLAGAMAIGSLAGWLVAELTDTLAIAMTIGAAVGALATVAVAGTRPVRALFKVVIAMGAGFAIGWGIGFAAGDARIGMAVAVPLGILLWLLVADTMPPPRHRPF